MVFNRNMLMNVQLLSDLDAIRGRKQQQIDDNNKLSNKKRVDHNYRVGEMEALERWIISVRTGRIVQFLS